MYSESVSINLSVRAANTMTNLTDWRKYALWKNLLHENKQQKF